MKLKTVFIGSVLLMAAGIFAAENNPLNGIVKVEVRTSTPNYLAPWQQSMDSASGSGVVISGRRILTNAHNIANSTIITIRKHNTDTISIAEVEFVDHGCDWLSSWMPRSIRQGNDHAADRPSAEHGPFLRGPDASAGEPRAGHRKGDMGENRQPVSLTLDKLRHGIPDSWEEQRKLFLEK